MQSPNKALFKMSKDMHWTHHLTPLNLMVELQQSMDKPDPNPNVQSDLDLMGNAFARLRLAKDVAMVGLRDLACVLLQVLANIEIIEVPEFTHRRKMKI